MILYLMRHGQTDWNVSQCVQGWVDTNLNPYGILQVKLAVEKLRGLGIESVYSSDLKRCRRSGEIASALLDIPLHYTKKLREMNFGQAEGMKKTDLQAKFPHIYPAFNDIDNLERYDVRYPQGESIGEVQQRFIKFLYKLAEEKKDKVLIVTHGMLIRIFAESCFKKTIRLDNASVLRVNFDNKSKKFKLPKVLF